MVDSLETDIVQVMVRKLMDAQERRRQEATELMKKNRARVRDLRAKGRCRILQSGTTCLLVS